MTTTLAAKVLIYGMIFRFARQHGFAIQHGLAFGSSRLLFFYAPTSPFSAGVGFHGSLRDFIIEETTYRLQALHDRREV